MSEQPPRFNLRLTPDLKADLTRARAESGRSMNAEILARLSLTFNPDPAMKLADAIRPALEEVPEGDRSKFVDLAVDAIGILGHGRRRKKPSKR